MCERLITNYEHTAGKKQMISRQVILGAILSSCEHVIRIST